MLLGRQVNVRGLSKAHAVDVTGETLITDTQAQLDSANIGRLLHDLLDGEQTEGLMVMDQAAEHHNRSHLTIDDVGRRGNAFFYSRDGGDDLKCRSGLIGQTDGTIAPGLGTV